MRRHAIRILVVVLWISAPGCGSSGGGSDAGLADAASDTGPEAAPDLGEDNAGDDGPASDAAPDLDGGDGTASDAASDAASGDVSPDLEAVDERDETETTSADTVTPVTCPTAVIDVTEGVSVPVGTTLHLSGLGSTPGNGGPITAWAWSVQAPAGSSAALAPDASSAEVTFTPDVAGAYSFRLTVDDASDHACDAWTKVGVAVGGGALELRVDLFWSTPEGSTHPAGSPPPDPNLHLAHPDAGQFDLWGDAALEPWYDLARDMFWGALGYGEHDWGVAGDASDDPTLVADIESGASGAERIVFDKPEAGLVYRIGVDRYASPNEAAAPVAVVATVNVFLGGGLVGSFTGQPLLPGDFWEVATIDPTTSVVTPIGALHAGVDTCPMPMCN